MRILMVLVRDPGGPSSGRKCAIRSAMDSLTDLGHAIHVVVISDEAGDPRLPEGVTFERLASPCSGRAVANIIRYGTTARLSLNECLTWSPKLAREIRRIAINWRADLLLADTLRAFPLAAATGFRIVTDLDDLLSRRYRSIRMAPGPSRGVALGSYGSKLPHFLRGPAAQMAAAALYIESRLVAHRELQIARRSAAVCLVSAKESAALESRAGARVFWTPPAIPARPQLRIMSDDPDWSAVYVGGLDFGPNLQALRWFRSEVVPLLLGASRGAFRLSVIGQCSPNHQRELSHPAIDFVGYVDDLEAVLSRTRAFVAPVVSGAGLKIKVLDAMARAMPVIATSKAVEGLPVEDRVHAHVADSPAEFAHRLREVASDGQQAVELGRMGRDFVTAEFSRVRAAAGWRSVIASMPAGGARGPRT